MKPFQVTLIRSKKATERESLLYPEIEQVVGNYDNIEDALEAYAAASTGSEIDKELRIFDGSKNLLLKSTYNL